MVCGYDYIEYNPSLHLQFNVKENKRYGSLNSHQKKELIEKSKTVPHLHLSLLIAMLSGLRLGEIRDMKWNWVDFNNNTLRIPPENTKNKKGFYIVLSSTLLDILKKEKDNRDYKTTHVVEYKQKQTTHQIKKTASIDYVNTSHSNTSAMVNALHFIILDTLLPQN